MNFPISFLNDCLRIEHIALTSALGEAVSDKQYAKVASDALSFAVRLLAERTNPHDTHNFMGVSFWYFQTVEEFVRNWPGFASDKLALDLPKQQESETLETTFERLAEGLKNTPLIVLKARNDEAEAAPVLVMDASLTSHESLLHFLFAIALKRTFGPEDRAALQSILVPVAGEDKKTALFRIIYCIVDSAEAHSHDQTWIPFI